VRGFIGFKGQWSGVAIATAALLALSFVLGGASRQHELRLALVELAALPALVLGVLAFAKRSLWTQHAYVCLMLAAIAALPLLQIIPLPPGVWTNLPGRNELVHALTLADIAPAWSSWSLAPDRTWRSFLALLPPFAVFLGVLAMNGQEREKLVKAFLWAVALAIALGAVQFTSGSTQFYLWTTTAAGNVVGFFANRNHMATLCLVSIPFAAVLGASVLRRGSRDRMALWLSILFIALAILALGAARSRTGVILLGPTCGASLIAAWVASGRRWPKPAVLGMVGAGVAALIALSIFAVGPVLERFDTIGAKEGRFENWPTIMEAADVYLPFGSGIGSFDAVFRSVEPLALLDPTFFNQAHNDYLETWLEAGWLGGVLVIAFLLWFGRRTIAAWRGGVSTARDFQRAASIGIAVVLVHSGVDYPLRTATMATVFAMLCALLELANLTNEALTAPADHGERRRRRINR
jgi:O-antigen ligase